MQDELDAVVMEARQRQGQAENMVADLHAQLQQKDVSGDGGS